MDTVRSKDDTKIAFDEEGAGSAVIFVDGAMSRDQKAIAHVAHHRRH